MKNKLSVFSYAATALLAASMLLAAACETEQEVVEAVAGESKPYQAKSTGYYMVELWGSQGGSINITDPDGVEKVGEGGKGAYVKAYMYLDKGDIINLTVGGQSKLGDLGGGGGVDGTGGAAAVNQYSTAGGGATDIRYNFDGDDKYSLDERILVAAGGGGASEGVHCGGKSGDRENCYEVFNGGHGGAAEGGNGMGYTGSGTYKYYWVSNGKTEDRSFSNGSAIGKGGGQTAGGAAGAPGGEKGSFGQGGKFANVVTESTGGGGGGWYGGGSGGHYEFNGSGGGGSSYVAGLQGYATIPAVQKTWGDKNPTKKLIVLDRDGFKPQVTPGNAVMPKPTDSGTEIGHSGEGGYCRITYIGDSL